MRGSHGAFRIGVILAICVSRIPLPRAPGRPVWYLVSGVWCVWYLYLYLASVHLVSQSSRSVSPVLRLVGYSMNDSFGSLVDVEAPYPRLGLSLGAVGKVGWLVSCTDTYWVSIQPHRPPTRLQG